MKYGAIDIGSNAIRLLIGEVKRNEEETIIKKIEYIRIPLRLGMDVFENGIIPEEKQNRFIKAMQAFQLVMQIFEVENYRICATSAMRDAANSKKIIQEIKNSTSMNVEIISGDEEAKLILDSILLNENLEDSFIVIDVGGGSTEISTFEKGKKTASKSFQLGTIRLLKEKVDKEVWNEIDAWIKENIDLDNPWKIYSLGGNINKISRMIGKEDSSIKYSKFKKLFKEIASLSISEREFNFKLNPDRADVIVPAFEIFDFIYKKLDAKKIYVPKVGIADGMLLQLHSKNKGS